MKKVLSILLIALILVSNASLVSCSDNSNPQLPPNEQQTVDDYEDAIAQLQNMIDKLNKEIINLQKEIEELKSSGMDTEAWNEATLALPAKLEKLQKVAEDFIASFESEEDAGDAYDNFYALYIYHIGDVDVMEDLEKITEKAVSDLERATSVKAMDDIIAAFDKALKTYPTKIETLDVTLKSLEGKITIEKFETYVFATHLFDDIVYSDILPVDEDGNETAKEGYEETLEELFEAFRPIAVDAFIAAVENIPEVKTLSFNHKELVKKAHAAYYGLTNWFYSPAELAALKNKDFHNAVETLAEVDIHMGILEAIYGVELGKDEVPTSFETAVNINWLIASYTNTTIKADLATDAWLDALNAIVKAWEETVHVVGDYKYVVVDEDGKYVDDVYNMIDRATLASYNTAFAKATADLAKSAQAFIDAVAAFEGRVTPNSKAALDAAYELYKVAAGRMTAANLDKILGYDIADEDGNIPMGVVKSFEQFCELGAAYADIISSIKSLETWVTDTIIIKCGVTHTDKDGNEVACDGKGACENVGKINYTLVTDVKIAEFDAMIVKLLGVYGLDETVFHADALVTYKALRYYNQIATITAEIKAANDGSDKGNFVETLLLENLEKVATDYTFAVKFVCADPDNKDHKEHTSACKYVMNIENDPAEVLEAYFSTAKINEAFGK